MAIAVTLAAGALLAGLPGAIFGVPLVASIKTAAEVLARPSPEAETSPPPEGLPPP
jgi:predicted PurR-regulated permease PerM